MIKVGNLLLLFQNFKKNTFLNLHLDGYLRRPLIVFHKVLKLEIFQRVARLWVKVDVLRKSWDIDAETSDNQTIDWLV